MRHGFQLGIVLLALGGLSGLPAGAAPKAKAKVHVVTMENMKFEPPELTVKVGDSIEWINNDLVPHTASAQDGTFDSSGLQPGKKWRFKVSKAGEVVYVCRFHPTMLGKVTAE